MAIVVVRLSRDEDLSVLAATEKAADAAFGVIGLNLIAEAAAPTLQDYRPAHEAGMLLVAADEDDVAIGFVRIGMVDGQPHVEQVSVHPDYRGRRIGADLLDAAQQWARTAGYRQMTLTTYRDVPWNGLYYAKLGWVTLSEERYGPELKAVRQHERDLELDGWPRQAMVKHLTPT